MTLADLYILVENFVWLPNNLPKTTKFLHFAIYGIFKYAFRFIVESNATNNSCHYYNHPY